MRVTNHYNHGRPGYLVHDLSGDSWFASQRHAAKTLGISEGVLSKHLDGKIPNAKGRQLERAYFAE